MEPADLNWPEPSQAELERAQTGALACLVDQETASLALAEFYDPRRGYAGRTFLDLKPVDPWDITPSDLLSVTMLNVTASPLAIRRLLGCGVPADSHRLGVLAALKMVDNNTDLADASTQVLHAAEQFYLAVKAAIGSNPWVTASKLCARKRPALIPVRDEVVVTELELANRDFRTDWLIFRYLLRQPHLMTSLRDIAHHATTKHGTDLTGIPALRLLDTILWKMRPKRASLPRTNGNARRSTQSAWWPGGWKGRWSPWRSSSAPTTVAASTATATT
jgi:hypothetical protein